MFVRCKCGRQLLWTVGGRVTCPAGHTLQFDVLARSQSGGVSTRVTGFAGTEFDGALDELRIAPVAEAVNLEPDEPRTSFDPATPLNFVPKGTANEK